MYMQNNLTICLLTIALFLSCSINKDKKAKKFDSEDINQKITEAENYEEIGFLDKLSLSIINKKEIFKCLKFTLDEKTTLEEFLNYISLRFKVEDEKIKKIKSFFETHNFKIFDLILAIKFEDLTFLKSLKFSKEKEQDIYKNLLSKIKINDDFIINENTNITTVVEHIIKKLELGSIQKKKL